LFVHVFSPDTTTAPAAIAVPPPLRFEHAPGSDGGVRTGITLRPNRLLLKAVPR